MITSNRFSGEDGIGDVAFLGEDHNGINSLRGYEVIIWLAAFTCLCQIGSSDNGGSAGVFVPQNTTGCCIITLIKE